MIPAASSSVGLAAIQIANKVEARPIALTRNNAKRQALLAAGATHVIATEEQDLVKEILDTPRVGKAHASFSTLWVALRRSAKLTQANGEAGYRVPVRGIKHGADAFAPCSTCCGKWITIRGYVMMEIVSDPKRLERGKQFINGGLGPIGRFPPLIDKTFPLAKIVEAHRYLESNQQVGKIIVTV